MAMSAGRGGDLNSEINVTPLVDVCLVLLIIFMVVTPMLQAGVDVALPETIDARMHYVKMNGSELFKVAVRMFSESATGILARHGFAVADVDLFIPHQANLRIIEAAAKRLGLPKEKVFLNLDRYGNTGAASIYVALEEAVTAGRVKAGDLVLLAAFGGGVTWGAALYRW